MANVLKALKETFPDIYKLLIDNQKEKNLIFLAPNNKLYDKNSLRDKSFYYNHIFHKSEFDPTLYTNFCGKVFKLINEKTFKSYLGWTKEMIINIIESNYNDEGLFFFQIDGICDELASDAKIVKTVQNSISVKKCLNSKEYLEYYSNYNLPLYNHFQKGIKSMDSFIFSIINNYLLIKGHEEYFAKFFNEKITKFISAFEIIFKNNPIVAKEYVDTYIFSNLYDIIMKKLDSFYSKELKDLKIKLNDNIDKYSIKELKLDESLLKCDFNETYENIDKLKNYKTSFEKTNCLIKINSIMLKEAKTVYEKENEKKFEIQGDLLIECWTYILSQYIYKYDINNIYLDYLFFNYFHIGKGYEENDYIIKSFIMSMELLKKELLSIDNTYEQMPSAKPVKIISFGK